MSRSPRSNAFPRSRLPKERLPLSAVLWSDQPVQAGGALLDDRHERVQVDRVNCALKLSGMEPATAVLRAGGMQVARQAVHVVVERVGPAMQVLTEIYAARPKVRE